MTTALPHPSPESRKPAPPIVVVDQSCVLDQADIDTEIECPALADAVVEEMLRRAASFQENPDVAIPWEEFKAQLRSKSGKSS